MSHENAKQPGADKVAGEKDQEPVTAKQPGGKKNEEFSMFAPEVSSEFLRSLINGSDDAIISKSLDGKITGWNPAADVSGKYRGSPIMSSGSRCMEPCGGAGAWTAFCNCISARFFSTHSTRDSFSLAGFFGAGSLPGVGLRLTVVQTYVDAPLRGSGGTGGASPVLSFPQYPRAGRGTSSAKHALRMSPSVRSYLRATMPAPFDQTSR